MRCVAAVCVFLFLGTAGFRPPEVCRSCVEKAVQKKRCVIDFCNCSNDHNTVSITATNELTKIAPPKMLCREDRMMMFTPRDFTENTIYYIEYIHKENPDTLKYTALTICKNIEMLNLEPESLYNIRLYGINVYSNTFVRSSTTTAKTHPRNFNPSPVDGLFHSLDVKETSYDAFLYWSYKDDNDRSCCFEILWFDHTDGEHFEKELREPRKNYTVSNLHFGKEYFFTIMGTTRNRLKESQRRNLTITIPTCAETYGNLKKCRPETPSQFRVEEILTGPNQDEVNPIYDIVMNWSTPKLYPNYYSVDLITHHYGNRSMNISGEATEAVLRAAELGVEYDVRLTAWSPAGPGAPARLHRRLNATGVVLPAAGRDAGGGLGAAAAVAAAACLGALAAVAFCAQRRRARKSAAAAAAAHSVHFLKDGKLASSVGKIREVTIIHEKDEWEIQEELLTIISDLGKGAFGIVQKGLYKKNVDIAVKMLKDKPTNDEVNQFYDEIEIMKSVPKHPHLVSLIGIITKGRENNPLMLVEYCAKGDLQSFLRNTWEMIFNRGQTLDYVNGVAFYKNCTNSNVSNKMYDMDITLANSPVQPKDFMSMARQIVLGMEFLSGMKVIHRDLAARNVLVCEDNTIKISDFGLSRDVYRDNVYLKTGGGKLPFRWMALESMTHQRYTTQSDVWSFGILLWEIVTLGSNPYPGVNTQELLPLLKSGYRMEQPPNCSEQLYTIMMSCWRAVPQERPTFSELLNEFETLLENETSYLSLNIVPPKNIINNVGYNVENVIFPSSNIYHVPFAKTWANKQEFLTNK